MTNPSMGHALDIDPRQPAVVLLSGGMDSTAALAYAYDLGTPVLAVISVNYGQRHVKEIDSAKAVAEHYGVPHHTLDLTSWGASVRSALTSADIEVPDGHYTAPVMAITVVPNRNATMLMSVVGVALSLGAKQVITAVHSGDHAVYPDCRPEFIEAADQTAQLGTDGEVSIRAPFVHISKTDIARIGDEHGAPFELTWSCYKGGDLHCGTCGTCYERREAFMESGVPDPTAYLSTPDLV